MSNTTQAQIFAAAYAKNLAKANLNTIRYSKLAGTVIMTIAMVISYTHQRDYLLSLGAPMLGACLIPVAFDAATFVSVKVAGTPAMLRSGRTTALAVMPFPVGVSMWVNFSAPGAFLVKVIFALTVGLIVTTELVTGKAGPDFKVMDQLEREVTGSTSVTRKPCPEGCTCGRHNRRKSQPTKPVRTRRPVSVDSGYVLTGTADTRTH